MARNDSSPRVFILSNDIGRVHSMHHGSLREKQLCGSQRIETIFGQIYQTDTLVEWKILITWLTWQGAISR